MARRVRFPASRKRAMIGLDYRRGVQETLCQRRSVLACWARRWYDLAASSDREVPRPLGRNSMITWLSAGEGLVAAAIAVIGSAFTFSANRRAQYDHVLALTAESASSPIADDRHTIGKVFEPPSKLPADRPVVLTQDEIAALFRVLWYVQRVDALYASLHPPFWVKRIGRAQALLLDSVSADLEAWQGYVVLDLEDPDSQQVVATSSARGLWHLSEAYERLRAQRAHNPGP